MKLQSLLRQRGLGASLGKWSNLRRMFFKGVGWNHQLGLFVLFDKIYWWTTGHLEYADFICWWLLALVSVILCCWHELRPQDCRCREERGADLKASAGAQHGGSRGWLDHQCVIGDVIELTINNPINSVYIWLKLQRRSFVLGQRCFSFVEELPVMGNVES